MSRYDQERIAGQQASAAWDVKLAQARANHAALEDLAEHDAATILELWVKLEQSGMTKAQLRVEKGALALRLQATKLQLAALRQAQRAAESRAALFRDVATKLKGMIDSGELEVVLRDGRMVIVLHSDVLFDSGRVEIKPAARESLRRIAVVLEGIDGRHIQVAGHTDTVPISTPRFASNWDLSSGRALMVTSLLIEDGVPPESLSAAGYGQFDPVGDNGEPEGRAKNRRIEITLMPEIVEQVAIPE